MARVKVGTLSAPQKKRHEKKSLRENVVVYSVMRFQIQPRPNSTAHARQVHRGQIASECLQLATTASWHFRVTNSSLFVHDAICVASEEKRVRHYEAPAHACSQLQALRSDRSVADLSRVPCKIGQSRNLVPPVQTTCSFLKNDVF